MPTDGEFLAVGSARAAAMEALGLEKLRSGKVGFVLVAGGLGERLGEPARTMRRPWALAYRTFSGKHLTLTERRT